MATNRQRLLEAIKGNPDLIDRLLVVAEPSITAALTTPEGAYQAVAPLVQGEAYECLAAVAVNRRNSVIGAAVLSRGSDAFTVVCPRQIFRWALQQGRSGAHAIILAHNHPSGDPTPSRQDIEVTRRVRDAGAVLGIKLLDHIVVGHDNYTSLAEQGYI